MQRYPIEERFAVLKVNLNRFRSKIQDTKRRTYLLGLFHMSFQWYP